MKSLNALFIAAALTAPVVPGCQKDVEDCRQDWQTAMDNYHAKIMAADGCDEASKAGSEALAAYSKSLSDCNYGATTGEVLIAIERTKDAVRSKCSGSNAANDEGRGK